MFDIGDVVRFHSAIAGKEKFHLCVGRTEQVAVTILVFLFINSEAYRGDYVFDDGEIPGLPKSRTGSTVLSFSQLVRVREEKLSLYGAKKTGAIDARLAGDLATFAKTAKALTEQEKAFVVSALESLFI